MNKDLISRQDAIKEVSKYVHSVDIIIGNGTLSMAGCVDVAEEILEGLPSMESEPKWIPCTEKLPESGLFVLCSTTDMGGCVIGYYVEHCNLWFAHIWWHDDIEVIVNAWMPLPPCYKGE